MTEPSNKSGRWNLRVAPEKNQLVREAAVASRQTLSDFVLQAAVGEAERVLADRTRFALGEPEWDRFAALLDRPARANPRLAELFEKPTVFE